MVLVEIPLLAARPLKPATQASNAGLDTACITGSGARAATTDPPRGRPPQAESRAIIAPVENTRRVVSILLFRLLVI